MNDRDDKIKRYAELIAKLRDIHAKGPGMTEEEGRKLLEYRRELQEQSSGLKLTHEAIMAEAVRLKCPTC